LDDTNGGEDFDPSEQLSAEQILAALESAVASLPRDTRMVFMLVRFRDMSYPDIARFMNISTRTVARKMADAMQILHSVVEASQ
jgi:RNA polymerase sigma factor (sigma-70 family)